MVLCVILFEWQYAVYEFTVIDNNIQHYSVHMYMVMVICIRKRKWYVLEKKGKKVERIAFRFIAFFQLAGRQAYAGTVRIDSMTNACRMKRNNEE